ncbi:DUF4142 domain-containing protein [Microbispora sp. H10885]|uniref:DUF4142 domain-containing protein n=1 Tax=Microbispora sp. H10885 TaxID=2729110 RepID=UPI0016029BE9|nr:DUF4142 domain-containing protein [Microbispora sp. H10885]
MLRSLIVTVATVIAPLSGGTAAHAAPPDASDQDKAFLVSAHQDNLTEIEGGHTAEKQAGSQAVKDAGSRLVKDHTALDEQVTKVAAEYGVDLPGEPTEKQQAELRKFAAKSGAAFDRAWVPAQVEDHRMTLVALDKEASTGSSEKVRRLARDTKPVVQEHLDLMESIQRGG